MWRLAATTVYKLSPMDVYRKVAFFLSLSKNFYNIVSHSMFSAGSGKLTLVGSTPFFIWDNLPSFKSLFKNHDWFKADGNNFTPENL